MTRNDSYQGLSEDAIHVAVVDDDPLFTQLIVRLQAGTGFSLQTYDDGESFLASLSQLVPDVVCLDLAMPGMGGLATLERFRRLNATVPVLVLTADAQTDSVVAAMRGGAYDYLTKPVNAEKLSLTIRNAATHARTASRLEAITRYDDEHGYAGMLGRSRAMKALFEQIERVAPSPATVLVQGEAGSGKLLAAHAIHALSSRARGPCKVVECSTVAVELQEPIVLGHARGAFRGARAHREGLLDAATGGTIVFHRIEQSSAGLQSAIDLLLRRGIFRRVGDFSELRSDVRVISTMRTELAPLSARMRVRADVLLRLAAVTLTVPPLRDRPEDILLLANAFLRQHARLYSPGEERTDLSADVKELLHTYKWPGNVLELSLAIQGAALAARGRDLVPGDFPEAVRRHNTMPVRSIEQPDRHSQRAPAAVGLPLTVLESRHIAEGIATHRWNLTAAARELGIGRTTLYRKIKAYGLR